MTTRSTSTISYRSPKPEEKRPGYSIYRLTRKSGKKSYQTLKVPELVEINRRLLDTSLTPMEARTLVKDLVKRLDRRENAEKYDEITNHDNIQLLESYWREDYQYRDLIDPGTMKYALKRAINVVGALSLLTVDKPDLHKAISKADLPPNKKRSVIARINQLLKFAGRNFRLSPPKPEFCTVKYLNEPDTLKLAKTFENELIKTLIILGLSTGCRLGELFAIKKSSLRGAEGLWVGAQVRKDGTEAETKTRKGRKVYVLEFGREALSYWVTVPTSDRMAIRGMKFGKLLRAASKKLWPKSPEKHIRFHDLRHSYAIEMLRLGESKSSVADLLGDSVSVVERYYTGSSMKDESFDALAERMRKQR